MMWQIIIASSRLPNVDSLQFAVSLSGEEGGAGGSQCDTVVHSGTCGVCRVCDFWWLIEMHSS